MPKKFIQAILFITSQLSFIYSVFLALDLACSWFMREDWYVVTLLDLLNHFEVEWAIDPDQFFDLWQQLDSASASALCVVSDRPPSGAP